MKMYILLVIFAIAATASSHHLSTEEFVNGIAGFYEIDHDLHPGQHNDWYHVEIIWNQAKGSFTWQNRAGVTWTLIPRRDHMESGKGLLHLAESCWSHLDFDTTSRSYGIRQRAPSPGRIVLES